MKKLLIEIVSIFVVFVLIMSSNISVFAATQSQLNTQKSELNEQIEDAKEELNNIKTEKSQTLQEVEDLIVEISGYESQSTKLKSEVSSLQKEIEDTQKQIDEKQKEYEEQSELLDQRMIAVYENGQTSYLDFILSSNSLVEFISNYYLAAEIASCDTDLIDSIEKTKNEIQDQKTSLETKKTDVSSKLKDVETVNTKLKASQTQKNAKVAALTESEKQTQSDLEQFEQDKRDIEVELRRIAEANKNKNTNVITAPSASGYTFPIAGKTKANITCGWYGYSGHTGVDVAISAGTPVLAVKDGTVITSKALVTSSGAYRSYGEYIVIDHHDGTMTLYAHMQSGSRRVQAGDSVKRGQQIGNVGTTGNSTGNHLHFEVRVNGSPVNPVPYLP